MSDPTNFLQFLLNEDIYLIKEEKALPEQSSDVSTIEESKLEDKPDEPITESTNIPQVADAKNELLIIFDNPNATALSDDEIEYLKKIMGAIKRDLDQVDFLNVANATPKVEGYKYVISFTPNHQLQLQPGIHLYTSISLNQATLVIADSLTNISVSTDLRKKLWTVLQQLFVK